MTMSGLSWLNLHNWRLKESYYDFRKFESQGAKMELLTLFVSTFARINFAQIRAPTPNTQMREIIYGNYAQRGRERK